MKVTVLMSTYNGQQYLEQQMDSILSQRGVNVEILVRDDCSFDNTLNILRNYEDKYDNVHVIEGRENWGACRSFLYLIRSNNTSKYYALSDQDDIWDTDKLLCAVEKLDCKNINTPLLYYSNLRIIDKNGNFIRLSHRSPHTALRKYSALSENLATGCTIVYNNRLAKIAEAVQPVDYSMHDAWLYLVAKLFGETVYDFDPHINYRIHGDNEIGTYKTHVDKSKVDEQIRYIKGAYGKIWSSNAKKIYDQFSTNLSETEKNKLLKFINYDNNIATKFQLLFDKDYYTDNTYRKLKMITEIMLGTL